MPAISSAKPVLEWSIIPATISAADTHSVKCFLTFIACCVFVSVSALYSYVYILKQDQIFAHDTFYFFFNVFVVKDPAKAIGVHAHCVKLYLCSF